MFPQRVDKTLHRSPWLARLLGSRWAQMTCTNALGCWHPVVISGWFCRWWQGVLRGSQKWSLPPSLASSRSEGNSSLHFWLSVSQVSAGTRRREACEFYPRVSARFPTPPPWPFSLLPAPSVPHIGICIRVVWRGLPNSAVFWHRYSLINAF